MRSVCVEELLVRYALQKVRVAVLQVRYRLSTTYLETVDQETRLVVISHNVRQTRNKLSCLKMCIKAIMRFNHPLSLNVWCEGGVEIQLLQRLYHRHDDDVFNN
jgi:hypothetical protein